MHDVKQQCMACLKKGIRYEEGAGAEGNHMKSGNIRISHAHSYGLCQWHHRRVLIVQGWGFDDHRDNLGPSLLDGSRVFHETFGTDAELLNLQEAFLRGEHEPA